jgi:hypothetical protein
MALSTLPCALDATKKRENTDGLVISTFSMEQIDG